ncbi:tryptophan synthase subunit alpha [Salinispira pacifica]|uniref:Tryptophan synthase alpha chain n=1 Tax=Salinispira pacifica TaxID=1307761 RepID=V5WEP5_9SPIO|nr:tryptophan synthase subunit alpha [Salinispira pacifica]AHC13641.1 Tryptophan synthase alpha chain [Salinispira pacifica]
MIELMAHMIPYYPDAEISKEVALRMLEAGTKYLEVQFPFSDPSADGPVIEEACQKALNNGFRMEKGFEFVSSLMKESPRLQSGDAELFVMTYASPVTVRGVESFVQRAARAGVRGLIIPDLPPDSDEGLYEACRRHGVEVIPVLATSSRPERVELAATHNPRFIYCALRKGITGQDTVLGGENITFIENAGKSGAKIMAGFGISRREQVEALDGHAHAAVVGSAFLRALHKAEEEHGALGAEHAGNAVADLVSSLLGK